MGMACYKSGLPHEQRVRQERVDKWLLGALKRFHV
jgi:hypothetical protein